MAEELWKDVPNFKGLYKVSNTGKILSLNRIVGRNGNYSHISQRIKKQSISRGETTVVLCKHGNQYEANAARLIANAFVPNPHKYSYVKHKDGNITNNSANNLIWCSNAKPYNKYTAHKMEKKHYQKIRLIKNKKHYDFNSMKSAAIWIKHRCHAKGKIKTIINTLSMACEHRRNHDKKGRIYIRRHVYGFKPEYLGNNILEKRLKQPKHETWRSIANYPNYEVSNYGAVRSKNRIKVNCNGIAFHYKSRILRQGENKQGYKQVGLTKNNQTKTYAVHRLVAKAFIPNPHHYPIINHKDENTRNNKVSNLEWCTVEYNNTYGTKLARLSEDNRKPLILSKHNRSYRFPSVTDAAKWLKQITRSSAKVTSIFHRLIECCKPRYKNYQHVYGFRAKYV